MITYKQQLTIIKNVLASFEKGEIVNDEIWGNVVKYSKLFYNPEKFEQMTIANFKIMIIHLIYNDPKPTSVKDMLEIIREYTKSDFNEANKLRSEVIKYDYTITRDLLKIEESTLTPYALLKMKEISPFTFAYYYKRFPQAFDTFGKHDVRMVKQYYKRARVLVDYFKLDEDA